MDEQKHDPSRGFVAGYNLIVLSQGLPFAAAFLRTPNGWGREMTSVLDKYNHMSGVWICGDQMPMEQNGVALHPTEKDQYGLPVPIVSNSDHANDALIVRHALGQWKKMNDALGSNRITEVPVWPAAHNLGTNRMSEKASDGVVNKWGQTHDIANLFISDGSQFTSSAVCNPTLTIVALAIRQAEYITDQMKQNQI